MTSGTPSTAERGFSLIEVMIALIVLTVGVLGIAQVMAFSLAMSAGSGADLVAHQKATEAIESVFTARDSRIIQWSQIRNVAQGGVFLNAAQPLRTTGDDGLINTGDNNEALELIMQPGPDGQLGTADDVPMQLSQFTRQITISDVIDPVTGALNPNLRRLRVTITYRSEQRPRTYIISTFISAFS